MSIHKYKTKKGEYWYVKYKNRTKRGFTKKSEAQKYEACAKLYEEEVNTNLLFYDLIDDYLKNGTKNITYGTYQKKEVVIRNLILNFCPNKNIHDFSELDCRNFRNELESLNYSTAYKNYILRIFKSLFKYAVKFYELKKDPTYVIENFQTTFEEKMKKKENAESCIWSEEEFEKFISFVENDQYKAFFITLFYTGMRLGEIQALQWKDFKNGKLSITKSLTSKTNKGAYEIKEPKTISSIRTISLGNNLTSYLEKYKDSVKKTPGFNDDWFIYGNINPLPSTTIARNKDKAIQKAGVKRITIHGFRHSHASNLIASGMNIVAVSKRLGHENVEITLKVYTHLLKENEDEIINYINNSSHCILAAK